VSLKLGLSAAQAAEQRPPQQGGGHAPKLPRSLGPLPCLPCPFLRFLSFPLSLCCLCVLVAPSVCSLRCPSGGGAGKGKERKGKERKGKERKDSRQRGERRRDGTRTDGRERGRATHTKKRDRHTRSHFATRRVLVSPLCLSPLPLPRTRPFRPAQPGPFLMRQRTRGEVEHSKTESA
jgi:hypothetical protein